MCAADVPLELLSVAEDKMVTPFLEFLGCIMSSPRSPLRCIATVRTDFLAAIQTRAELVAWKDQAEVYSLPLMKPYRFYDVIRRPAEKVGITFESDALVDRIVKETGTRTQMSYFRERSGVCVFKQSNRCVVI